MAILKEGKDLPSSLGGGKASSVTASTGSPSPKLTILKSPVYRLTPSEIEQLRANAKESLAKMQVYLKTLPPK